MQKDFDLWTQVLNVNQNLVSWKLLIMKIRHCFQLGALAVQATASLPSFPDKSYWVAAADGCVWEKNGSNMKNWGGKVLQLCVV